MEKQVYCLIHPRRKLIKFVSKSNVNDATILREKLKASCKTDHVLSAMMKNKEMVFQLRDESGEWCDMDEDEQIKNKSEINILLIFLPAIENADKPFNPSKLKPGEAVEMDLNLVYTEPQANVFHYIDAFDSLASTSSSSSIQQTTVHTFNKKSLNASMPSDCPTLISNASNKINVEDNPDEEDEIVVAKEGIQPITVPFLNENSLNASIPNESPTLTSESDKVRDNPDEEDKTVEARKRIEKGSLKTLRNLPTLSILPKLSFDLKSKIEKNGVLLSQHHLIRFWGQYLMQETVGKPSRQDYYNFASTIVAAYPELQGGHNMNGIVRTQLSTWVRNHRVSDKKVTKRRKQVSNDESEGNTSYKKATVATGLIKIDKLTESDITRANEELKKFIDGKNVPHFKRLLSITKTSRRLWIENKSTGVPEILTKFSPLGYYEMIIYECINVVLNLDENEIFSNINIMLDELFNYYTHEENQDCLDFKIASDKNKSTIVHEVCRRLLPKRLKKTHSYPLWEIKEVMSSTDCLTSTQGTAPRAVLFVDKEEETIQQAFIVAEEDVRVEVPEPTTAKHTLTGHCAKVMAAKFLGEPSKVVTGSYDRTLKIWDLRSRACVETKFTGSSCNDLVTSDGSGSTIISGHFDKTIRFWDTRTESGSNDIVLQGKITSLDLSRDANYLLSCVRDDTLKLLDLRMKMIVVSFSADNFKVGCDWARATFSPDGQYVAVGSSDGSIFIWSVTTNKIETVLKDHTTAVNFFHRDAVHAVSWYPHGSYLASVDKAKWATIWGDHV